MGIGESSPEGLLVIMVKGETPMGESVTVCTGEGGKGLEESELKGKVRQVSVEESWGSSGTCRPT